MTINCQPVRWFARLHSIKWATIPDEMTTNENCPESMTILDDKKPTDKPSFRRHHRQSQITKSTINSQTSQSQLGAGYAGRPARLNCRGRRWKKRVNYIGGGRLRSSAN